MHFGLISKCYIYDMGDIFFLCIPKTSLDYIKEIVQVVIRSEKFVRLRMNLPVGLSKKSRQTE